MQTLLRPSTIAQGDRSIEQFNSLIGLESEYATYARKMSHSLQDLVKANNETAEVLKKLILAHNASAAKRMPKTIFRVPLPQSIDRFRT